MGSSDVGLVLDLAQNSIYIFIFKPRICVALFPIFASHFTESGFWALHLEDTDHVYSSSGICPFRTSLVHARSFFFFFLPAFTPLFDLVQPAQFCCCKALVSRPSRCEAPAGRRWSMGCRSPLTRLRVLLKAQYACCCFCISTHIRSSHLSYGAFPLQTSRGSQLVGTAPYFFPVLFKKKKNNESQQSEAGRTCALAWHLLLPLYLWLLFLLWFELLRPQRGRVFYRLECDWRMIEYLVCVWLINLVDIWFVITHYLWLVPRLTMEPGVTRVPKNGSVYCNLATLRASTTFKFVYLRCTCLSLITFLLWSLELVFLYFF